VNFPIPLFSNRSRREKSLAAAIGALLLVTAGTRGYGTYRQAVELRQATLISAEQALSEARADVQRSQRARHRLQQWRKKSLPTDHDIARSLYQDWLHQELTQASMQVKELRDTTSGLPRSRPGQTARYRQFTFSVRAQGTLEGLARFLYQFYAAPHLHGISTASLNPTADRRALNLALTIEAIAVPGCQRTDQLAADTQGPAEGSAPGSLEKRKFKQTLKAILSRNPFAAYRPNQGPTESASQPTGPVKDTAEQAKISGMTYGGGGWRLAVRSQDTGRTLYFRAGDRIHIGQFEGTIARMDGRQVVIETASGKRVVRLGQSLVEGTVVP
jgi:hypothetical protein